jgi:hypothetical protein
MAGQKRRTYKADFNDIVGYRSSRRNPTTGAVYVLYDTLAEPVWLDPDDGRWVTMCEQHSTLVYHETKRLAELHLPYGEWCEECMMEETRGLSNG